MFTTKNLFLLLGRQILIIVATIIVASLAIFFLSREIEQTTTKIFTMRQSTHELEKRTELFSLLRRDAEIVGTNHRFIEEAFPSSGNILKFTAALEELSLKHSFTPTFHFGTPQSTPITAPFPLGTIAYDGNVSANMSDFIAYLEDFEALPYFTKIENISFSTQDKEGWEKTGNASFRALLYLKNDL